MPMNIKEHLADTFRFNDHANRLVLERIREIGDADECVRLFSHLILCMDKWLARVEGTDGYWKLDWWEPVYPLESLADEWQRCFTAWLRFIERMGESELRATVQWYNPDIGGAEGVANYEAEIVDIALQLNYHAIHHRAQIQSLIRAQGIEPAFVDYIGTRFRRI